MTDRPILFSGPTTNPPGKDRLKPVMAWKLTITIDGDTHTAFPCKYVVEDGVLTMTLSRGREPLKLKHIPMRIVDEITAEEIS